LDDVFIPFLNCLPVRRRGCSPSIRKSTGTPHTPPSGLRSTVQSHGIKQYVQKNANELQYKIISSIIQIAVGHRADGGSS